MINESQQRAANSEHTRSWQAEQAPALLALEPSIQMELLLSVSGGLGWSLVPPASPGQLGGGGRGMSLFSKASCSPSLPAQTATICPSRQPGPLEMEWKSKQASPEGSGSAGEATLGPCFAAFQAQQLQNSSWSPSVASWISSGAGACKAWGSLGLGGSICSAWPAANHPQRIPSGTGTGAAIPRVWDLLALAVPLSSRPWCHMSLTAQCSGMWPVLLLATRWEGILLFPGLERLSQCPPGSQSLFRAGVQSCAGTEGLEEALGTIPERAVGALQGLSQEMPTGDLQQNYFVSCPSVKDPLACLQPADPSAFLLLSLLLLPHLVELSFPLEPSGVSCSPNP